jgi:glutathione S-transferase
VSAELILWQFIPSPNARKARLALGAKGASYETRNLKEGDTGEVIRISGQPLTPMLQHGDTVIFDSGAIVRYVDANVAGPRLFSTDPGEMQAIEGWETRSKAELFQPLLKAMREVRSGSMNAENIEAGRREYHAAAGRVQDAIRAGGGHLVGGRLTAADLFTAAYVAYGYVIPAQAEGFPSLGWAMQALAFGPELADLRAWYENIRPLGA